MEIVSIDLAAVTPKDSTLSYVEDGRYSKDGAWCVADIELTLQIHIYGTDMEMPFTMEMKSGQICKPKTTIAQWTEQVSREMDIQGIEEPKAEDTKTLSIFVSADALLLRIPYSSYPTCQGACTRVGI